MCLPLLFVIVPFKVILSQRPNISATAGIACRVVWNFIPELQGHPINDALVAVMSFSEMRKSLGLRQTSK
jgi:hypothetical protein